ncbi:MAG: sulfurtransferase [Pseudomonadales bacterium]|nr:sulfurtransferase [Pseudomonadales bacterium]MCP5182425.1 sulfurtransferase [Pseudomonadales bacterium]
MKPADTLMTAQALAEGLPDIRVLDCRARLGDPGFGARVFAEGHIPGAQRADLDRDLAAAPGKAGRHPLPDADALVARCREWGIDDAMQVVVYDDMGGMFAARAWWLLRWLGHDAVAVLDGGWSAWLAAGGTVQQHTATLAPGHFTRRTALTRTVSASDLLAAPPHLLLDARAPERFEARAEPIDRIAGHIPGARCVPASGNLDASQHFLPASALRARFPAMTPDCVCYCGSGVTAAHNILAMRVAGWPEPALYPGSWSEWIEDPDRPVATGP